MGHGTGISWEGQLQLFAFCAFEFTVGIFFPSMMKMRSQYVPEEMRATIINFFRIPLNLFVCIVLYNVRALPFPLALSLQPRCLRRALQCAGPPFPHTFCRHCQLPLLFLMLLTVRAPSLCTMPIFICRQDWICLHLEWIQCYLQLDLPVSRHERPTGRRL